MTIASLTIDITSTLVKAQAYCLPQEAMNALDTGKFWTMIIAVAAAVIGLLIIGIGAFIDHQRGEGHAILKKLMIWIIAAAIISAASGIANTFIQVPTDCIPLG